ncbi:tyrosine-type recombinase/integrase [Sphingomonas sp. OTU376]|uniref:tyrosine-type recombinase/integrase n=1 Tax=Sphingomonas sp. OTU376 TaxID=3043863 RepID=UPI00313E1206
MARTYINQIRATRNPSEHTALAYASDLKHFKSSLGGAGLEQANNETILDYIRSLAQSGAAARTIRRRVACLRGFYKHLADTGGIECSPFDGIALRLPRAHSLPRSISRADTRLLATAAWSQARLGGETLDHQVSLAVLVLICTGIRVGELTNLLADEFRIDDGAMRVQGKGHRERLVFITDSALGVLLQKLAARRAGLSLFGIGEARWTTDWVRRRLRAFAADAGVRHRVTPHMLRHTCATLLLEDGVDLRFLQRLLGHENISTTAIYAYVGDSGLQRALETAGLLSRLKQAA